MPHNHEWLSRVKDVEREFLAMRQAANRFRQTVQDNPLVLKENLRLGDIASASRNLEATYFIRMFAEFETGARQYWAAIRSKYPKTADLLDGLAARRKIPDPHRLNAHSARIYRNTLVHERENASFEISIAIARGYLCRYLSYLPPRW